MNKYKNKILRYDYQGVAFDGNPIYYDRLTGKMIANKKGYGTPLFGNPLKGLKQEFISRKKFEMMERRKSRTNRQKLRS